MQKPKLSVIMTVRNSEDVVSKTIDSILNQTFKDFEFLIINDASTDGTGKILEEYEKKDKRVKLFTNKKNKERCWSRNFLLEKAKGEYVAVTDGDDISLPTRFAKEVVYLDQNPDCYLVGAKSEIRDEEGKKIGESWSLETDGDITDELPVQNRLVHSSVMFRNTGEFLYREKFKYAQDYDLFLQMILKEKRIHLLNEILVVFSEDRDLKFDDYLVKQAYFAEIARYLYREEKENLKDRYDEIDTDNLEQYVPEKLVLEMEMKQKFFHGDFKKARELAGKLIDIDPSPEWRLYYFDTFFKGNLGRIAKKLKRRIKY